MELPEHSLPPLDGAGLLQVLVRSCCPPPQVAEQLDHEPQLDQPPFTEKRITRIEYKYI